MNLRFLLKTTVLLLLTGHFTACSSTKDVVNNGQEINPDESLVDIRNVKDLYSKSLPVIQKCMEGIWKLIRVSGGWDGGRIPNDGEYMILTSECIKIGNNSDGVIIDAPIIWEKIKKFLNEPNGGVDAYFLTYSFIDEIKNITYSDRLLPDYIINDTLVVWDLKMDGYFKYYIRIVKN